MPPSSSRLDMLHVILASLLGGVCMLLIGMGLYALSSHDRTEDAVYKMMLSKGGTLLSSLESSLRSSRRGNAMPRQDFLLEEMAGINDVMFVAIVGPGGFILAHNNPKRLGEAIHFENRDMNALDMERLAPGKDPQWLLTQMEDGEAFVVYKQIGQALISAPSSGRRTGGSAGGASSGSSGVAGSGFNIPLTLFIGLDPTPLFLAKAEDNQRNHLLAVGGIVCSLFMLIALYWSVRARRSRQRQRTAEALTQKMMLSLPDGLILFDGQGRISHINLAACEWLRQPAPPLGRKAGEVLPPELAALAERLLAEPSLPDSEIELPSGDTVIPLSVGGGPMETREEGRFGHLLLLRDLSERKRLEAEIRRREKLAAVGNLAAGVAHEIRNPLSSIKGYATYFGERFAEGSDDRKAAQVMVGEVERLNRVITDLLELARPASIILRPTDLKILLEDTLRLIRRDASGRSINFRLEALPLPPVNVDPDRLRQALLNLCLNALDAMSEGGELIVSLLREKDHAVLEVRDTGKGIAPNVLPNIFDPYFTTKGRGTGLGLAIVHKIVEAHGGHILVDSTPGQGTTFRIMLPLDAETDA